MEQLCPRCFEKNVVKSTTGSAARYAGLVGTLIANSTASYQCPNCGKIPISEFPDEFQAHVKKKRVLSVLGAVGILVVVLALLVARGMF
jgi:phage FluMu protein Com